VSNPELPIKDLLFESFSAYGTVGLSTGVTNALNPVGTILVAFTMLVGRVGPLIIGLKAVPNPDTYTYRKATETVTIG
jgi:trk system potassium uptake protein TrkH